MNSKTYNHKFKNLELNSWDSKTLILGTFNPQDQDGPEADFYYGRVRKSKKGKNWSNKFWPSLSSFVIKNEIINFELLPGDIESKIKLMKILSFNCLDLINSIETNKYKILVLYYNLYMHFWFYFIVFWNSALLVENYIK